MEEVPAGRDLAERGHVATEVLPGQELTGEDGAAAQEPFSHPAAKMEPAIQGGSPGNGDIH